jgi:hypothetical protein
MCPSSGGAVFSPDDGTHSCPKHVEKSSNYIKKNCAPSWFYLQERDWDEQQVTVVKFSHKYIVLFSSTQSVTIRQVTRNKTSM